jgi:transposase-like protein
MSALTYRCPKTSRDVTTAIDTDARALAKLRNMKVSVACPHCIEGHSVPANEMYFGQEQRQPLTFT